MSEPEIKTINELKIFVNGKIDGIEAHLKKMESDLKTRLDKIDADIRGNGKVGINVQLDRLENSTSQLKQTNESQKNGSNGLEAQSC